MPLILNLCVVLGDGVLEYLAMARTGTLGRRHRREWTCCAVALPFKAVVVASLVEYFWLGAQPSTPAMIAGALMGAAGIALRVRCHFELAGAFSMYVETTPGQQLVTTGPYAWVRHPMYVGALLLFVAIPMTIGATYAYAFVALGLVGMLIRIHNEDRYLSQRLPGYREYAASTWRLVPYVY